MDTTTTTTSSSTTSSSTSTTTTTTSTTRSTTSTQTTTSTSSTTSSAFPTSLFTTDSSTSTSTTRSTTSSFIFPTTPSFTRPQFTVTRTSTPTIRLPQPSGTQVGAISNGFFDKPAAVGGTFTAAGVIVIIITVLVIRHLMRRNIEKRFDREIAAEAKRQPASGGGYDYWNEGGYNAKYPPGNGGYTNELAYRRESAYPPVYPSGYWNDYQNGGDQRRPQQPFSSYIPPVEAHPVPAKQQPPHAALLRPTSPPVVLPRRRPSIPAPDDYKPKVDSYTGETLSPPRLPPKNPARKSAGQQIQETALVD